MKGRMRVCRKDGIYTLSDTCPVCNAPTVSPHPARFSPDDRFAKYRRRSLILSPDSHPEN